MANRVKDGVYLIQQQCFEDYEQGLKALNSQCKILKKLIAENSCGGFVMGLSMCDGNLAKKINLNSGKVGRPKVGFTHQYNPSQD